MNRAEGTGSLRVAPHLLNSGGSLWGGCGLSAVIRVAEARLDRGCLWATVQYVSPILAEEDLELRMEAGRHGSGLSQASVRGSVGGRLALLATGTFGVDRAESVQYVAAPTDVDPPATATAREFPAGMPNTDTGLLSRLEQRWARPPRLTFNGSLGTGRSALWVRPRGWGSSPCGTAPAPVSVALLAIVGDLAPAAISEAIGEPAYGASLDNSLRIASLVPTEWILIDITVEAVFRDVAQMNTRLFSEDGTLLAIAGQSAMVRRLVGSRRRRWFERAAPVQPS